MTDLTDAWILKKQNKDRSSHVSLLLRAMSKPVNFVRKILLNLREKYVIKGVFYSNT